MRVAIAAIKRPDAREVASIARRLVATRPISAPPLTRTICQLAEAANTAAANAPASVGVKVAAEACRARTSAASIWNTLDQAI